MKIKHYTKDEAITLTSADVVSTIWLYLKELETMSDDDLIGSVSKAMFKNRLSPIENRVTIDRSIDFIFEDYVETKTLDKKDRKVMEGLFILFDCDLGLEG